MLAKTGSYEPASHSMVVGTTGDTWTETFIDDALTGRAGDARVGLVRRPWPDGHVDFVSRA